MKIESLNVHWKQSFEMATSMLVTNVEDSMCWRQSSNDGDGFDRFRHQNPKDITNSVTNIEKLSPT